MPTVTTASGVACAATGCRPAAVTSARAMAALAQIAASLRSRFARTRNSGMPCRRDLRHLGLRDLQVEDTGRVFAEDVLARLLAQERQIVDRGRQVEVPVRVG